MAIGIVDCPINSMVIVQLALYVCLPEGIQHHDILTQMELTQHIQQDADGRIPTCTPGAKFGGVMKSKHCSKFLCKVTQSA